MTLHHTPRNRLYIRRLAERGLTPDVIATRCQERLIWDGPLPTQSDITRALLAMSIEIPEPSRVGTVGPPERGATAAPREQTKGLP